jgi:hypothetical protein
MTKPKPNPLKAAEAARKPYVKPSFKFEQTFETMALACGKIQSTQSACRFNRRVS